MIVNRLKSDSFENLSVSLIGRNLTKIITHAIGREVLHDDAYHHAT